MNGRAIEVRDLFRIHASPEGAAAALQGLSLAVAEREILVVLGPSGSGKTTLLRILAGLDTPSAGSVRVFGDEIGRLSPHALGAYRTTTVGYADQHYSRALEPELTARELVALQPGLRGVPARDRLRRADELLERVGLAAKRRSRPDELSGGEQQRVAVCAALAHAPRLFLADEPTGELDAANADLVYAAIADLVHANECTSVIVSHDPESAAIADRVVRIRDGRVSEESTRESGGEGSIVVGRGGWLRLPEDFLRRAGIRTRATARLDDDAIVVRSAESATEAVEAEDADQQAVDERPRDVVAEVRGLTRTYGSGAAATVALQELSASFGAARLSAVTGPSGSGKTTLLHLLAGLDVPTAGEVVVLGTDLARLDRDARRLPPRVDRPRRPAARPDPLPERARERRARALAPRCRRGRGAKPRSRDPRRRRPRRARPGRDRARARSAAGAPARRRADVAPRPGERDRRRRPARAACT